MVCLYLYTNFFMYSKFVHKFPKFCGRIVSFVLILCTNSYTNSSLNWYVNFGHEICTKLQFLVKRRKKLV